METRSIMTKIHPRDSFRQMMKSVKSTDIHVPNSVKVSVPQKWSKVLRFTHGTKMRPDDLLEVKIYFYIYKNLS